MKFSIHAPRFFLGILAGLLVAVPIARFTPAQAAATCPCFTLARIADNCGGIPRNKLKTRQFDHHNDFRRPGVAAWYRERKLGYITDKNVTTKNESKRSCNFGVSYSAVRRNVQNMIYTCQGYGSSSTTALSTEAGKACVAILDEAISTKLRRY